MEDKSNLKEVNFIIKRGLLNRNKRELIIAPGYIELKKKNLFSNTSTLFSKDEIADFRFGVKWLEGPYFAFGREYRVFIRNKKGQVIKISFRSYYGIKRKELSKLYNEIMNEIWGFCFNDIAYRLINRALNGENIEVGGVKLTRRCITIKTSGILSEQSKDIAWEKAGIHMYSSYFAIYSTEDSANINRGYSYLNDWNAYILYVVVKAILQHKKISNN